MSHPGLNGRQTRSPRGIAYRLSMVRQRLSGQPGTVTLGELIDGLGPAAFGLTLLLMAFITIVPLPGPFGMVFGSIIALISLQVMFGATRLRVPAVMRRLKLPDGAIHLAIDKIAPVLHRVERLLRPRRWLPLTGRLARVWLAFPLFATALVLALPIPMGNPAPAASLIAFSLGFIFRDGLAIVAGLGLSLVAWTWTAVLLLFGTHIIGQIGSFVGWQ